MARAVFLLCIVVVSPVLRAAEVRGFWRTLASMPSARQEVGVAELNGRVFVIGGLTASGAGSAQVDIYDPSLNTWQPGPSLPSPLHHIATVSVGGKVYSVGGFGGSSFNPVSTVLALDLTTGNWTQRAPLPTARGALAAAVIDGKIYAVGGSAASGNSSELSVYDPATDRWSVLTPMPTARNHHAAAAIGGKLFVVGGRSPNLPTLEVFDPTTGAWQTRAPMPTARSGIGAAAVAGFLFVFGGEIPGVFNQTEVYDPGTDTWFALDSMPTPRHGIGAAVVDGRIIIPGGATVQGFGATSVNDEFVVLSEVFAFAQFGDSAQISSQIVLTSMGDLITNFILELRRDDGSDLPVSLEGTVGSRFKRELTSRGTATLSTPGAGPAQLVGSAIVFSDRPLVANILFTSSLGFAGVPGQKPGKNFLISVLRNTTRGLDSGIALVNFSGRTNTVTLILRDKAGTQIASRDHTLAAFGHLAQLLAELFPGVNLDDFEGSVTGSALLDVAAMAILLRPNQMATLPVQVFE